MTIQTLPVSLENEREHRQLIATTINEMMKGRANNLGSATLGASTTTSIVEDPRITSSTKVFLAPASATAAAAAPYVSAVGEGQFTITHDSDAATDRIFDYVLHQQ